MMIVIVDASMMMIIAFVINDDDHSLSCIYHGYSYRFVSLLMNVHLMNMIGKQTMSINGQDFISIHFDENCIMS